MPYDRASVINMHGRAISALTPCEENFYRLRPLGIETRGESDMLKHAASDMLRPDERLCCKPSKSAGFYKWFAYQKRDPIGEKEVLPLSAGCTAVGGTPAYFSLLSLLMTILFK